MGAVAFLIAMGVVVVIGLAIAGLGLVGAILFGSHKKKAGCGISIAVLVVGLLVAALPVLLVGGILLENAKIPEDFQHTGIVIDENSYQPDTFTADGTVYHALELEANPPVCAAVAEAVFCYKPEGFLSRSQWGNYYRLENGQDFDLIWDGSGRLYCPAEQTDAVLAHYAACDNIWMYATEDVPYALSNDAGEGLVEYLTKQNQGGPKITETIHFTCTVTQCSADGIVVLQDLWLGIAESGVYDLTMATYDETEQRVYYGIRMPEAIADILRKELEIGS